MRRIASSFLASAIILLGGTSAKADWDYWAVKAPEKLDGSGDGFADTNFWDLYTVNSSTESATFIKRFCMFDTENCVTNFGHPIWDKVDYSLRDKNHSIDKNTFVLKVKDSDSGTYKQYKYSLSGSTFTRGEEVTVSPTDETLGTDPEDVTHWYDSYSYYGDRSGNATIKEYGNINARFGKTIIGQEGLIVDGNPLITKKDNGEIHIGKNSLITTSEEVTLSDGRKVQPLWAEDENENKIPINIDGSKLLIDGVEVKAGDSEQVTTNKNNITTNTSNISTNTSNITTNTSNISTNTSNITTNKNNINNLGEGVANATALTAALTALPQASTDSKFSCGVGTGTYSSSYALGLGCASKVNERVDVNFGGSYVGGGSKDYGSGSLDNVAAKAGFVFKLGKITKPTMISMKDKEAMQSKISELSTSNTEIKATNQKILASNEKIQSQNKELQAKVDSFELEKAALVARLEKLEQIALSNQKDEKTAFSFLNASNLFSSIRNFQISSN